MYRCLRDRYAWDSFAWERYPEFFRGRHRLPGAVRFSTLLDLFESEELPTVAPGTQRAYRKSIAPIRAYFVTQRADPEVSAVQPKDVKRLPRLASRVTAKWTTKR